MTNKEWLCLWLMCMTFPMGLIAMTYIDGSMDYDREIMKQCMEQMTYKECKEEMK